MINEFLQYLADVTCLGVVRSFEARVDVEWEVLKREEGRICRLSSFGPECQSHPGMMSYIGSWGVNRPSQKNRTGHLSTKDKEP
jgi:hypothetical protein